MGAKLLSFYDFVDAQKGLQGKMALAMKTKIPSSVAAGVPDSPETIEKFRRAVVEITGQQPPPV